MDTPGDVIRVITDTNGNTTVVYEGPGGKENPVPVQRADTADPSTAEHSSAGND